MEKAARQALMKARDEKLFAVPAPFGTMPSDLEREHDAVFVEFCGSREEADALITSREEPSGWA
jgi:hypothetical protein